MKTETIKLVSPSPASVLATDGRPPDWKQQPAVRVVFGPKSCDAAHGKKFKYRVPAAAGRFLIFRGLLIVAVAIKMCATRVIHL